MEKKLLFIFLVLSILTVKGQCIIAYNREIRNIPDSDKRNFNGNVKSVSYSFYHVVNNFGEISNGIKKCDQEILFNEDQTVKKITTYLLNGEIDNVDLYEYENGEKKFISHFTGEGILASKTAFIREGLKIREQLFWSDGRLNGLYFIRIYDLQENMIEEVWKYHENPEKSDIEKYYYDKYNRVIKSINIFNDIITFTYKDNFSITPVKIERFDNITKKFKISESFEYNLQGNIIKQYNSKGLESSYDYIYDNKNNWIKRTLFLTDAKIPDEIIERKINYFQ